MAKNENENVVYVARRNGIVGFFSGRIPAEKGWVSDGRTVDLSQKVATSRCTLEDVLLMENAHWIARERLEKEQSAQKRSSAA